MSGPSRRQCFRIAASLAAAGLPTRLRAAGRRTGARDGCTLSIGTYSLKGIALEEEIEVVAKLGYDAIEIAAQPGFDGEPSRMPPDRRKDVRKLLDGRGLTLSAIMEHLAPAAGGEQARADRDRLRRVMELAHDLAPDAPPLVHTVLGGGAWDAKKDLFRDRLGDWLSAAREAGIVLAIKPHRGGAMSRPEEAIWLIRQLGEPSVLRMVYDDSHYAFRDMPVEEAVRASLPYTAHVSVKDAAQESGRVVFLLPAQGSVPDHARSLRLLYDGGYRGDVCCEVSAMVSSKPGYDPRLAAKTCYENMGRVFERANIPRA